MRPRPNNNVLDWMDNQYIEDLFISSLTIAGIYLGVALLPEEKRKIALTLAANDALIDFANSH